MRVRWCAGLLAAAAIGGCGSSDQPASPDSGRLKGGGPAAFTKHLAGVRGRPVVVNQWASWCGPCRFEFPFLRSQSVKRRGQVAFVGVDARDNRADAEAFLRETGVSFPQFYDEDASIARVFRGGRSWPTTAFYGANGQLVFTHQGAYRSEADLAADIDTYALDG